MQIFSFLLYIKLSANTTPLFHVGSDPRVVFGRNLEITFLQQPGDPHPSHHLQTLLMLCRRSQFGEVMSSTIAFIWSPKEREAPFTRVVRVRPALPPSASYPIRDFVDVCSRLCQDLTAGVGNHTDGSWPVRLVSHLRRWADIDDSRHGFGCC